MIQNNQAFFRTFLRKKKGKYSSGNDNDWDKLADDVNKYSAMSGDADIYLDSSSDNDNDNDVPEDDNDLEDDKLIDLEMDWEQEKNDEEVINECEAATDRLDQPEFEVDNLALEPISVEHRREACALLSKVHDLIILWGPC